MSGYRTESKRLAVVEARQSLVDVLETHRRALAAARVLPIGTRVVFVEEYVVPTMCTVAAGSIARVVKIRGHFACEVRLVKSVVRLQRASRKRGRHRREDYVDRGKRMVLLWVLRDAVEALP